MTHIRDVVLALLICVVATPLGGALPVALAAPPVQPAPPSPVVDSPAPPPVPPVTEGVADPTAPADPAVLADPTAPAVPAPDAVVLGWRQLGLSDKMEINSRAPTSAEAPAPQGLTPRSVSGEVSVNARMAGLIHVLDGSDAVIASIPLPGDAGTIPFSVGIPAAGVPAAGAPSGRFKLSFIVVDGGQPSCTGSSAPPVTLRKLATTYTGIAANPRTVADFLPPYLDRISIALGPNPTRDQQQAALALIAKLTHRYRPMPVRMDIDTSPKSASNTDNGFRRTIAIRDDVGPPGLVVENPGDPSAMLVITASGPQLSRQIELFTDDRARLAQAPTADVTAVSDEIPESSEMLTFEQLDVSAEASVLGKKTIYAGFNVGWFAVGPIQRARVHLIANYTSIADGEAAVLIRSGPDVLASRPLDSSGVLDLDLEVPQSELNSQVGFAIEVRYVPQSAGAVCDGMTFVVDRNSTVTVTPGARNQGGFRVLPTAFMPDFQVALAQPDQLSFAAQAISLIGQQSPVALRPRLVSLEEAGGSHVGLLVVAQGDELSKNGMSAPLTPGAEASVKISGAPTTDVDINGQLGAIEAFSHNDRTVVAITDSGDGSLAQKSLDFIRGLDSGWAGLTGDVVATGPAGVTVDLDIRGAPPQRATEGSKWWTYLTLGAAAAAALVVLGILMTRRWRHQPTTG